MLAQSCSLIVTNPILKIKVKIKLLPSSISVIHVSTPGIPQPQNIYELGFSTFQLPEGIVQLDVISPHGSQNAKNIESSYFKY